MRRELRRRAGVDTSSSNRTSSTKPWTSHLRYLYPPVEVINLTRDLDPAAPEDPSFNEKIAAEGELGWNYFRKHLLPSLRKSWGRGCGSGRGDGGLDLQSSTNSRGRRIYRMCRTRTGSCGNRTDLRVD